VGQDLHYSGAFCACPSARLQTIPRRLCNSWAQAAEAIAREALLCLADDDARGFAAHVRLFLELPARGLALEAPCEGGVRTAQQRARLEAISRGKVPPIPSPVFVQAGRCRRGTAAHEPPFDAAAPSASLVSAEAARKAKHLIEQGLLSCALRALD
jgi:hypothetical protein